MPSEKGKQKRCVRCGYTKAWHGRVDGAPDHGFVPDYEDIVAEARALAKNMIEGTPRNLIIALADEVERLREQLRIYRNDPTSADTEYGR